MKTLTRLTACAVLAFAIGCGGSGKDSCDTLSKKVCQGKGDTHCKRVDGWLDKQLTGPDGTKLAPKQANHGCKLILDDARALEAYRAKATKELGS